MKQYGEEGRAGYTRALGWYLSQGNERLARSAGMACDYVPNAAEDRPAHAVCVGGR